MDRLRERINLLGTLIDKVSFDEASLRIDEFVRSGMPRQVVTANLDFLRLCSRDRSFQDIVNTSDMVVPDGMPLVWASRKLSDPLPERVAGVDLVSECARLSAAHGYRLFLLGAAPGVADAAASVLRARYPGVNVVGTYSPESLTPAADRETVEIVKAARPDILLVAFGAPKQEKWISRNMHALQVPVLMGVGGSFDMLSGRVQRAPRWMQRTGLEWFHRFTAEPGRLWKRYFLQDLPAFVQLMMSMEPATVPAVTLSLSNRERVEAPEGAGAPAA